MKESVTLDEVLEIVRNHTGEAQRIGIGEELIVRVGKTVV